MFDSAPPVEVVKRHSSVAFLGFINLALTVLTKKDSQEEYKQNKNDDCRSEKTVESERIADVSTGITKEGDQDAALMDASVMRLVHCLCTERCPNS